MLGWDGVVVVGVCEVCVCHSILLLLYLQYLLICLDSNLQCLFYVITSWIDITQRLLKPLYLHLI